MRARSLRQLSFRAATVGLVVLALPQTVQAASPEHRARATRAVVDCAAALQVALPDARITGTRAVQPNDSLRALGRKTYCRIAATVR